MSHSAYNTPPPSSTGECSGIPLELRQIVQWLAYRAVPKPNGKTNKPPIDAKTGESGSSTNPATWSGYDLAARRSPVGAAFVLTRDDPYFAIDLDQCRNPETGEIEPWALDVVNRFPMYWEVSYSHRGLRGIGRGVIPKDGCKQGNIEVYDHARLVVMTGRTLTGHETIRTCQQQLITWHHEVWPIEPARPVPPPPTSSSNRLTLDDLLAKAFRAKNGDAIRRLHEGDISGYPESQGDPGFSSEADLALAGHYCFYTANDGLVGEAMRASKLYRTKLDRQDYLDRTIARVRGNQTAWWDPNYGQTASRLTIVPPLAVGATCDEHLTHAQATIVLLTAQLQDAQQAITVREGVIARERELRIAAEERAQHLGFERSKVMEILHARDMNPGEKLTHFGTTINLGARIANGEVQEPPGFRLPAIVVAEMTGQKVTSVRRHWNNLAERGILHKMNVRERTEREHVDSDGEITTATGMRDVTYIHVPENNIVNLITPATTYQKPEEEKRGGRRVKCEEHPDAGTVKTWVIACAECHVVLDRGEAYQAPEVEESSGANFAPETPPVFNTLLRGHFSAPEAQPIRRPVPVHPSHANFEGQPVLEAVDEEPPDFWTGAPSEPEPWFWNEEVDESPIHPSPDPTSTKNITPPPLPGMIDGVVGLDRWTA